MQSIFNQMLHDVKRGRCRLKKIVFVWTVRDPTMVNEFGQRHWAGVQYDVKQSLPDIENDTDDSSINPHQVQRPLPKYFSPDLLLISQGKRKVQQTEVISNFHLTGVDGQEQQQTLAKEFPFLLFSRPDIEALIKDIKHSHSHNDGCACNCARSESLPQNTELIAIRKYLNFNSIIFTFVFVHSNRVTFIVFCFVCGVEFNEHAGTHTFD
ncbi:hypothetical protein RFI_18168 [Reticulomyxa filosa]|uniref:Uncharacterized protein n=1 Tax=Reticulomyxa filosa TaxID=46433 RepID=X6MZ27_RETFI|nr:hypothetical protein RFI_18168 [Reticulomyxa filosa]|eukprot:ETO19071.1 hypothetical protein RFI_18168 [Reticulomyxa filosa]